MTPTGTRPSAPAAAATPSSVPTLNGDSLGDDLLGTYFDAGEPSVGWHFLAAGDAFCEAVVATSQSCLKITRLHLGDDAPVDYGPLVVAGEVLQLLLLYDEDGRCVGFVHEIGYEVVAGGLRLSASGCLVGVPRDDLLRGEPH